MSSTNTLDKKQTAPACSNARAPGKKERGSVSQTGWQIKKSLSSQKQARRHHQRRYEGVTPAFQQAVLNYFGLLEFVTPVMKSNLEAGIRHALREPSRPKKVKNPSAVQVATLLKNPTTVQNQFKVLKDFHPTFKQSMDYVYAPETTYTLITCAPGHSYDYLTKVPGPFDTMPAEEQPIVYMLNDRRPVMMEMDARMTMSKFYGQRREDVFPGFWRSVYDNPGTWDNVLWSSRGKPMFSPKIRDSDVFAAAKQLNGAFFTVTNSKEDNIKTLCSVNRFDGPCFRPVLRGGRCKLHLTSSRLHVCPRRLVGEEDPEPTTSDIPNRLQAAKNRSARLRRGAAAHFRNIEMIERRLQEGQWFHPGRANPPTHEVWMLYKHYETIRNRCGLYQALQGEKVMCGDCAAEAGPERIPEMIEDGHYNEAVTVWNIHKQEMRDRLNRPDGIPVNHWVEQYNMAVQSGDSHRMDQILATMPVCPTTTGRISLDIHEDLSNQFDREFQLHLAMRELELTSDDVQYDSDASEEAGDEIPRQVQAQGWFDNIFGDIKVNVNWPDVKEMKVEHVISLPIVGKLVDALKAVNDKVSWTNVFMELGFFLAHVAAGGVTVANLLVTLAHLCYATGLATSLGERLVNYFTGWNNAQADAAEPAVIGVSAAIALIASLAIDKLPDSKSLDRLVKRVGDLGKFVGSANIISQTFGTSVEAIVDWLRVQLFGYSKLQEKSLLHVDAWLDEVAALRKTDLEQRAGKEHTLPSTVNSLLSRGDEIARLYDRLKVPLNQRTAFTTAMFFLNNARTIVSAHGAADRKMRACPPVIHFFGDSGCGKTTTLALLINHLLVALDCTSADDRARRVFWRDPTQEYWEGYQPDTLITIYDDFGTFLDSVGSPDIGAGELIQTANTYPKQLTMAHVDLKGQVNFESKVIILTSNVGEFVHNSMSNPEALANRISMKFRQYVKPEYAITRKLKGKMVTSIDKTKMPEDPLFTDAILFQQVSKEDHNLAIGEPLTFQQMVKMVVRETLTSLAKSDGMNKASEEHFTQLAKEYKRMKEGRLAANLTSEEAKPVQQQMADVEEISSENPFPAAVMTSVSAPSDPRESEEFRAAKAKLEKKRLENQAKLAELARVAAAEKEKETLDMLPEPSSANAVMKAGDAWEKYYGYLGAETMDEAQYQYAKEQLRVQGYYGSIHYNWFPTVAERLTDWTWWMGCNLVHVNVWESLRNRPLALSDWSHLSTIQNLRAAKNGPTDIEMQMMTNWATIYDHCCMVIPTKFASLMMTQIARGTADVLSGRYYSNEWCMGDPRRMWCLSMVRCSKLPVDWHCCLGEDHNNINGRFFFNEAVRDASAINTSAAAEKKQFYCDAFESFATGVLGVMGLMGMCALVNFIFSSILYGREVAIEKLAGGVSRAMGWEGPMEKALRLQKEELTRQFEEQNAKRAEYNDGAKGATKKNIEGAYPHGASGAAKKNIEATTDQNATEIVTKVANNQYLIFRDLGSGGKATGTATAITGRVFMTSRHIWNALQGEFCLANADRKQYIINKNNCTVSIPTGVHENKDIVLFEAPRQVHLHSSLKEYIVTREDAGAFTTLNRVALVGYDKEGRHFRMTTNLCKSDDQLFQLNSGHDTTFIRDVYRYAIDTQPGDCGAVLVAFEPAMARKIVASHSAGDDGELSGIGCAIHRELIDDLLRGLECRYTESILNGDVPKIVDGQIGGDGEVLCADRFGLDFNLIPIQQLKNPVFSPAKSQIRPSPVQGMIRPPTTRPAQLRANKKFDPLAIAMKKVTTPSVLVDSDCMDRCRQDLTATTITRMVKEDRRVLSFEEAIEGIVGNKYYPPINRATSPGFGWKKGQGRGKTPWLGEVDYKFDHPDLVAMYNQKLALAKAGRRIGTIWTDTLKSETRPLEKVLAGKTRLFSCGEMVSTILFRQYFGGYIAHITRNNVYNECAVGINVYGPDWERLFRHVTEVGPSGNAGDFENFDGTLGAALLWAVLDDIEEFYQGSEEDRLVRRILWTDIVNSVHVQGDKVYMWDHSQPSGCPFTSILNSRAQAIGLRYVFLKMAEKYAPEMATLDCYRKYVRLVAYGDDNVIGVHPAIQSWFNYQTLAEGFALLGMKYTDETKKEATVAHKRIEDVTFLKRGFRWEDGRLFAPLSVDTIVEMPNWVCGRGGWTLTAQIIEDALYELSQHDKATFDSIRSEFEQAIQAVQKVVTLDVYSQREYRLMTETRHWQLPVGVNRYLGVEPRVVYAQMDSNTAPGSSAPGSSASGSAVTFGTATETAEKHTITRFYHDGELLTSARATPPVSRERNTAISDGEKNTLIDILSRPIQIDAGAWSTTVTKGTILMELALPDQWTTNVSIATKLFGFRFFRCDFEVELQVNAQPFNAGALLMWYEPYYSNLQSVPTSTMTTTGKTGYPNVQLFLEDASSVKLLCPFVSNINAYTIRNEGLSVGGRLHLEVLSQLTGSADAEYTMYLWPKNLRLEQPTQGVSGAYVNAQANDEEWPEPEDQAAPGSDGALIPTDAIHKEEEKASKPGTALSKILSTAGKAVGVLSVIPEVGVIAAVTGGVLSLGGLIAGAFGWSKPLDHGTNQMVQIGLNRNLTNYNGDSKAKVAAVDATNKVDMPVDAFRSTKDEMAFRSMLGKELYMGENVWNSTDTTSTALITYQINPEIWNDGFQNQNVGGQLGTIKAMHYCGALSQLFRYWRGSFEFRFKLVKTQYHSGRLEVLWYPYQGTDAVQNPEQLYREVHDIRSKNEFVVKIPYNYMYPWASLVSQPLEFTGRLFIRVLNPLRAPTTVAQSIKILTYMRCGEDFQFAMPRSMRNLLVAHVPKPSVNAQANFTEAQIVNDTSVNQRGIGEAVLSARSLLKRYVDFNNQGLSVRASQDCVSANFTYAQLNQIDYLSIFGMFYRMRSGGVRILKSFTQAPGAMNRYSILREGEPDVYDYLSPVVYNWTTLEPTLEIALPFYQRVEFIPTNLGEPNQANTGYIFNLGTDLKSAEAEPTGTTTLRAISEDFHFGFLLGPPMVFTASPPFAEADTSTFDSTFQLDRVCAKRAAVHAAGGALKYPIHKVSNDVKDA